MKKTLLTGLQPSGDLHIGNYFGALKPFVDTYKEYDSFLMIADLHALTSHRPGGSFEELQNDGRQHGSGSKDNLLNAH